MAILKSMSKAYGICGLRIGYMLTANADFATEASWQTQIKAQMLKTDVGIERAVPTPEKAEGATSIPHLEAPALSTKALSVKRIGAWSAKRIAREMSKSSALPIVSSALVLMVSTIEVTWFLAIVLGKARICKGANAMDMAGIRKRMDSFIL